MTYDYFYGQQSELFTFYRVPEVLFTNERFWNISADAKMLYGILLDRMSLSAKNGWIDENGRVYIIFTIDEAKSALNCAEQKAIGNHHINKEEPSCPPVPYPTSFARRLASVSRCTVSTLSTMSSMTMAIPIISETKNILLLYRCQW